MAPVQPSTQLLTSTVVRETMGHAPRGVLHALSTKRHGALDMLVADPCRIGREIRLIIDHGSTRPVACFCGRCIISSTRYCIAHDEAPERMRTVAAALCVRDGAEWVVRTARARQIMEVLAAIHMAPVLHQALAPPWRRVRGTDGVHLGAGAAHSRGGPTWRMHNQRGCGSPAPQVTVKSMRRQLRRQLQLLLCSNKTSELIIVSRESQARRRSISTVAPAPCWQTFHHSRPYLTCVRTDIRHCLTDGADGQSYRQMRRLHSASTCTGSPPAVDGSPRL